MNSKVSGSFVMFVAMLVLIALPIGITLFTVDHPHQMVPTSDNPTPLGYTWSCLIFIIPVAVLGWWFHFIWSGKEDKRAFYFSFAAFALSGCLLDVTLGNAFFKFPNKHAVLGVFLWGYKFGVGWVKTLPIEEFVFYISGNLFTLLVYLWGTSVWFDRYNVPGYQTLPADTRRMFKTPHWDSLIYAVVLIIGAIVVKKFLVPEPERGGFPGYFIFEVCVLFGPTFVLFRSVKDLINWRAMGLSIVLMWLISVVWEATLALPYGWWAFNEELMLGIFIHGWSRLPIEEPVLWTLAPWVTAMLYEAVRLFSSSHNSVRETLLGSKSGPSRSEPT